jgi:streptogramin lyase
MRVRSMSGGSRALIFGMASAVATVSAVTGGSLTAAAESNASIPGSLSVVAVPGSFHLQQLSTGTDGKLWFVTPQSQLGAISASGQATLTGVVLPHGNVPAVIAGAGPEGVWSYGNNDTITYSRGTCVLALVTPTNVVHMVTLPSVAAQSYCGGAATDTSGNLWVSLSDQCGQDTCGQRVSFVVEVTPAGVVTLLPPPGPGKRAGPVTLASDGAIWALGGYPSQLLGRYTASGSSLGIQIPTGALTGLLARPDGTFWGWKVIFCSGQTLPFCLRVTQFSPGGTSRQVFIFPVGVSVSGADQLALDSEGSLWEAGAERTGPDRFFRMNGNGTVDRSAAFPTVAGSVLHDDGTLAVTGAGTLWSSAETTSGAEYLVRFQPV